VLSSPLSASPHDFERAAAAGPTGAVALCGIAVTVVLGLWFAFYFLAFLPRGLLQ
jgi:hypothetical protein